LFSRCAFYLFACVLIRLIYSPFVSGIAAKIWAANPDCRNKEIREALIQSASPLGDSTKVPNNEFGYGLVQAVDAFQYIANNFACAATLPPTTSPSYQPTKSPTLVPSVQPSAAPTPIPCQHYLESCVLDSDCCKGFECQRISSDKKDSFICRNKISPTKPRLSSAIDGDGRCRGGFANGCKITTRRQLETDFLPYII
jgi:hypothetical protein